jgi:hypothetical protein
VLRATATDRQKTLRQPDLALPGLLREPMLQRILDGLCEAQSCLRGQPPGQGVGFGILDAEVSTL